MKFSSRLPLLAAIILLPHFAFAASMSVLPPTRQTSVGGLITARVSINSAGVAINQGQADIEYPANLLTIVSVSKSSSIFSFWVTDPTTVSGDGTISFNAGLPTPGYSGTDGTVVTIVFKAIAAGTANITLGNAAVRANDGLGTDVLQSTNPAIFAINPSQSAPPLISTAPVVTQTTPIDQTAPPVQALTNALISLTSATDPNQSSWYPITNPSVNWLVPTDASEVEVVVSNNQNATPSVVYNDTKFTKKLTNLADGIWYFNLRYRLNGVFSRVSSYVLHVDTTAPAVDSHNFVYDSSQHALVISISAHDYASGVEGYELSVDGGDATKFSPDTFAGGTYNYPITEGGTHTVILRVIDKAGNHSYVSGAFTVPESFLDTPIFSLGFVPVRLWYLLIAMAIVSLASLLIAVFALYELHVYHVEATKKRKIVRRRKPRVTKEKV